VAGNGQKAYASMKFAVVEGQRREAQRDLSRGACPDCRKVVIAKCGPLRVPHWAHLGVRDCDVART
jgi:competence CoiA-like predicted nuclease